MYNIYIRNKNDIIMNNNIVSSIYQNNEMKEISMKAWSYLFQILKEYYNIEVKQEDIVYNKYNKPYLKDNDIYFNISHSKDMIAIIISDKECGIDIEYVDYKKDVDKIKTKIMSDKEIKTFNSRLDKHKYFYKIWTKKEAYFKSRGMGLDFKLLTTDINLKNVKTYIYKYKKEIYFVSFEVKNNSFF